MAQWVDLTLEEKFQRVFARIEAIEEKIAAKAKKSAEKKKTSKPKR